MKLGRSNLRLGTAIMALVLLATSLILAAHGHAASNPEKSETCTTCHVLPEGLNVLSETPVYDGPTQTLQSEILFAPIFSYHYEKIFSGLIRGPPVLL